MKKTEQAEPELLVLRRKQRTTLQIVNAAKAYASVRWRFDPTEDYRADSIGTTHSYKICY